MAAAKIEVFTFKDGLLARLAHDLRLSLRRFELRRDGDRITGTFWPGTLVVDGAVGKHGLDTSALSADQRGTIVGNMAEVLQVARHPEVTVDGTVTGGRFAGTLTLVGRGLPIEATLAEIGGVVKAEVVLVPSRWGIAPYRALAGAIKLQDRVVVRVEVPAGAPDPCVWSGPNSS